MSRLPIFPTLSSQPPDEKPPENPAKMPRKNLTLLSTSIAELQWPAKVNHSRQSQVQLGCKNLETTTKQPAHFSHTESQ